ncbi:MAG: FAD-dependent oxidoreductase [Anaerolineae bacterium]|nr:FAD-dependent oxidoreductase [Anaerolineae bacterium]
MGHSWVQYMGDFPNTEERLEMTNNADVLIIGGGFTGLMAATRLEHHGKRVMVLDKGRSIGGRMATRRLGERGVADHGAQFFTVRTPLFQSFVDHWLESKLVFLWSMGWSSGSLAPVTDDGHPRYAVSNGMNALMKQLASALQDVRINTEVSQLQAHGSQWQATDTQGAVYHAPMILLTPPVPQSLALLETGRITLNAEDREQLNAIEYLPNLTGLFAFDRDLRLPPPGAVQRRGAPISWIGNNKQKGISEDTVITVQADGTYSAQLWEDSDDRILNALFTDLRVYLSEDVMPRESQLKRWRYAYATHKHPQPYLLAQDHHGLMFAGDAFGTESRVEGAFTSGYLAGEALAAL